MMLFYTEKEVLSGEDIFDSLGLKEALHPYLCKLSARCKAGIGFSESDLCI